MNKGPAKIHVLIDAVIEVPDSQMLQSRHLYSDDVNGDPLSLDLFESVTAELVKLMVVGTMSSDSIRVTSVFTYLRKPDADGNYGPISDG